MDDVEVHRNRPEPVLFLLQARDAMEAYRKTHSQYAPRWNLLDIDFARKPFRLGDPGTHPTLHDAEQWCPKDCRYTYWIRSADKNDFLIEAVHDDVAEYEIRAGMKEPKRLPGSKAPPRSPNQPRSQ